LHDHLTTIEFENRRLSRRVEASELSRQGVAGKGVDRDALIGLVEQRQQ